MVGRHAKHILIALALIFAFAGIAEATRTIPAPANILNILSRREWKTSIYSMAPTITTKVAFGNAFVADRPMRLRELRFGICKPAAASTGSPTINASKNGTTVVGSTLTLTAAAAIAAPCTAQASAAFDIPFAVGDTLLFRAGTQCATSDCKEWVGKATFVEDFTSL